MNEIKIAWDILTRITLNGVTFGALLLIVTRLLGKNFIDFWFKRKSQIFQAEIDKKSKEVQSSLDRQLEQLKIQMSILHTERLNVVKDLCKRFVSISNQINNISSFDNYECKHYVDFAKDCLSKELLCNEDCIVNYWVKIKKLDEYIRETYNFLEENQMFFSLDIVVSHLKFLANSIELTNNAIKIGRDSEKTENERALECIGLFKEFDKKTLKKCQSELNSHYREIIGVSELSNKKVYEIPE